MADENTQDPVETAPAATDAPEAAESAPTGLDVLKRERDEYYDRLLRQAAEFDNYRKRVERERRAHAERGIADVLRDLLVVVDDFDRALAVPSGEGAAAYRKGIELIHSKLQELLRKQGVTPIQALGADFDPNLHQAVMHESSDDHHEGEVISELQRGYMLGDRLLRPSMVKVAKA